MFKFIKFVVLFVLIITSLNSCWIQRNKLFKIPKGSDFTYDTLPSAPYPDYKIAVDDKISFSILANNGEKIFLGGQSALGSGEFTVKSDGFTYIPLLGEMKLLGLTIKECELLLVKEFSKYINDPYIKLSVSNSRVIVFTGGGGNASIIPINNAKTTLLEVVAQAGGIPKRANASNIKLIRTVNGKRKVFLIDLSTIDKLDAAEMLVQANDYIYIEENVNIAIDFVQEITPYLSLLTFAISTYTIFKTFSK